MIVDYTKLHSYRKKADVSFEISNEKIRLFLSMLLLSGCYKLPDRKINLQFLNRYAIVLNKQ